MIPIRGLRAAAGAAVPSRRVVHVRGGWTPARDAVLRQMWNAGHPAREIAEAIGAGLSRNAVIGRARRLGLERRGNPVKEVRRGAE